MSQMARHLKAEHAQGVPSRLMQPVGGRPPSQPRVPIHLMVTHSTNTPGSGASSSSSSRQPTPGAGESVLQSRVRAAPTHVVPRYDVYGFALPGMLFFLITWSFLTGATFTYWLWVTMATA